MRLKVLLIAVAVALAGYFAYWSGTGRGVREGEPAPVFTLPSQSGPVRLGDLRGQVLLLNFWATWCPPCVHELPSMERLQARFVSRPFRVLAVSEDEGGWSDIEAFRKVRPLRLTVLLDRGGETAGRYGTYRLPETFLIDRNGIVVRRFSGPRDWEDPKIVAEIEKLVPLP